MKELFIHRKFTAKSETVIAQANAIIEEYDAQGFTLTLRQIYYQFVARTWLPNTVKSYKRLGSVLNDARLAGKIDWDAMEDRTRYLNAYQTWERPQDSLQVAASRYRRDWWDKQKFRPEVWIEKDALTGVIEPVCREFQVPYYACRGYSSQSEQYRASKRIAGHLNEGRNVRIFYLGDHDPSGMDMTRDHDDRLEMFLSDTDAAEGCKVIRVALNMDQVRRYNPPPNPNKETDSRTGAYTREFGPQCWELDALNPPVIAGLLRAKILQLINQQALKKTKRQEQRERNRMQDLIARL